MLFQRLKRLILADSMLARLVHPLVVLRKKFRNWRNGPIERFLSRSLPGKRLTVELPQFGGVFTIDVRSHVLRALLRTGQYESELLPVVLDNLPYSRDAIDVGANCGLYSTLLARNINPDNSVLAIEPNPRVAVFLRDNIRANGLTNQVKVFAGAASDYAGTTELYSIVGNEEYSSCNEVIHTSVAGMQQSVEIITCNTVDQLSHEFDVRPGFIKIDVEGLEHRVLMGAKKTLQDHRPILLCEASGRLLAGDGKSIDDLLGFLRSLNYEITDASSGYRRIRRSYSGNLLARPRC